MIIILNDKEIAKTVKDKIIKTIMYEDVIRFDESNLQILKDHLDSIDDSAYVFSYEHRSPDRIVCIVDNDSRYYVLTNYNIEEISYLITELAKIDKKILNAYEIKKVLAYLGYIREVCMNVIAL